MNLTSCNKCGVVLDKDKLPFPPEHNEAMKNENYEWSHEDGFIPVAPCPVCKSKIKEYNDYE